jgi:hypothetical protein
MRARLAHLGTAARGCRGCRRGRIAGVDTLMRWLARGGDHGAWSLGWGEARVARLWMARGIGCEEGARPHRGPGIQRAHRRRGRQPSDLQERWWARQGLNLRLLPCQQNTGNRCARSRSPRSGPTVEAEGKRSPDVQLNALFRHLDSPAGSCVAPTSIPHGSWRPSTCIHASTPIRQLISQSLPDPQG